ncbi:MAG: OmpA family protein [bacterium]|nr:OmpA family protein [bacterium]
MASERSLDKLCGLILVSYICMTSIAFAAPHVTFASPMGEEKWKMTGSPLGCGLSLVIPNYGIGYFEQFATKPPHFILRKWQEGQRKIPALVLARPPVWKPLGASFVISRAFITPGDYGMFLSREPALKLLSYLSEGYQANFNYISEEGFSTTVALSPIHFKKGYARYQQCLGGLLPFDYDSIKESTFHFGVESRELTDKDKDQLRRIAQYVEVDGQIEMIHVVGYTDDRGRKGYNNAISEYRAETVKKYLIGLGVPKKKLSVTWVGVLKPIARNDTDEGRAANRRVTVNVIKK